jgi:hypothetical protein
MPELSLIEYNLVYNMFDALGPAGEIGVQVGYTLADVTAKALYGFYIYRIAKAKSDELGFNPDTLKAA